jgi:putative tryptophan/tyrosine transport system substrate-binding protein
MKRIGIVGTLALASVLAVAGCSKSNNASGANGTSTGISQGGSSAQADASVSGKKICLDMYVTAPPTTDVVTGVHDALKGTGVDLIVQNPQGDPGTQETILSQFIEEGCDLFMPLTTPGVQATAKMVKDKPIVFAGSSTPVQAGVLKSLSAPGTNVTGVSDPFPVVAQINAMQQIDPSMKSVGIIWQNGDPAGDPYAQQATARLRQLGINVVDATISSPADASQAAQSLVGRVQAIFLPDSAADLAAETAIIKIANDNKIAVFGGDGSTIQDGGIISSAYNYVDVGKLGAALALKILHGANPATTPVVIPPAVLSVNTKAASALGLTVPASLHAIPAS